MTMTVLVPMGRDYKDTSICYVTDDGTIKTWLESEDWSVTNELVTLLEGQSDQTNKDTIRLVLVQDAADFPFMDTFDIKAMMLSEYGTWIQVNDIPTLQATTGINTVEIFEYEIIWPAPTHRAPDLKRSGALSYRDKVQSKVPTAAEGGRNSWYEGRTSGRGVPNLTTWCQGAPRVRSLCELQLGSECSMHPPTSF